MQPWLKVIGTSKWPLRNDWGRHAPPLLRAASFAKRPGADAFKRGDYVVYHALGECISRVVAIARVAGHVRYDKSREEDPGWPWLVDIEILAKRDLISDGFPLDLLDADRRLSRSVTQKSHIRLHYAEFERARRLFGV